MITNDEALAVVREQLALAEHALDSLRREVLPRNKRNFEVLSEGYVDQIAELQAEIDAYQKSAKKGSKANGKSGKRGRKAS
jgi:hypothetical protein